MVMPNASKKMPLERRILASIAMEAKNSPNFARSRAATPPLAVKTLDRAKFGEKTHPMRTTPGKEPMLACRLPEEPLRCSLSPNRPSARRRSPLIPHHALGCVGAGDGGELAL